MYDIQREKYLQTGGGTICIERGVCVKLRGGGRIVLDMGFIMHRGGGSIVHEQVANQLYTEHKYLVLFHSR